MLNFMSNFNATKKLSVTSVLFSLLILFFSLNGGFCTNFCSATYKEDANEYSSLEKSKRWYSNGNEEEGENDVSLCATNRNDQKSEFFIKGSDEDDQNNSVDVNAFVNASVKWDPSGTISSTKLTYNGENNLVTFNMEETASIKQNCQDSSWDSNGLDKDEYFAINADGTLVSKSFNEEEAKNDASGSDEYDRNNFEEDYKEYSPSGEGDDQKVKTKTSLNGEDQQETLNDVNSQAPKAQKSKRGDLCPSLFSPCKPW